MPTYDYKCKTCGGMFDVFQSIKAKPLSRTKCQICGKTTSVTRQIGTGGAVIFKGSGFYQTDYRSEGYKKAATADSDSKSKTADTGDAKTAKSDTSADTKSTKPAAKSTGDSASTSKPKKTE
jgi:putative FmdB family regulatory protein